MEHQIPTRDQIPAERTWDVDSIYATEDAWEQAVSALRGQLQQLGRFEGHLTDSPDLLFEWLETYSDLGVQIGKIYVYANCRFSVDMAEQHAAGLNARAMGLYAEVLAAVAFAEPELLRADAGLLNGWVAEDSRLATYAHYLDTLERRREHVRSGEVEELLGAASEAFNSAVETHGLLADADLVFPPATTSTGEERPISQGNYKAHQTSSDRELRRTAWENYSDAHLALKNTMANCIATGVKQNVFNARARRYDSALQAAVSANHIPESVFHNVIDTFRANLPIWHRYWDLRRRALGYDALYVYDIAAPLTDDGPTVAFEQALDWICEGLAPMGDEYVGILRRGALEERWIDRMPNQGKASGAFSSGSYGTHPFVLMSYSDDLWSLSTLAHELGHSLHSHHAWSTQPPIYGEYSIFVAEVASNVNQAMVRNHLFRTQPDRGFQIALIEEAMSNFYRYFFLMPTLARFELELHERIERNEALTADGMIDLMADLFAEGYGGRLDMDRQRAGITWASFHTHLYANFYVYQYTTGIAAAHALCAGIEANKPGALDAYLGFLRAGGSLYPLDALKLAGVDMTSPAPIEAAFQYMDGLLDRLEGLLSD